MRRLTLLIGVLILIAPFLHYPMREGYAPGGWLCPLAVDWTRNLIEVEFWQKHRVLFPAEWDCDSVTGGCRPATNSLMTPSEEINVTWAWKFRD